MRSDSSRQEYAVLDRGCACLQCKRRKKRCDGNHPVCGPCQRFGTAGECQFPSPPKPSPPRTKAHAMRLQIHELENQLATLQNIVQMNNVASYTGSGPSQPIPSSSLGYMTPQDRDPEWAPRYHETDAGGHALGLLSFPPAGFQSRDMHTPDTPPDPSVRERLLVNFLANRHRCLFECDEAHFMDRFHAPSGSPNSMHPGLISAALLLGNYFPPSTSSDDQFSSHSFTPKGARDPATEVYLLQETKHHLTHNLASSDRLVDFMRGTALLTWYYFAKGSVQEARWYAAGMSTSLHNPFAFPFPLHRPLKEI
ncbi:hypothetical protein DL93DRAFT_1758332 [Clavulina sp. PMI_390]|nr:hypothetical protein DL93DRAFT_1758332 [Clavulina sp. PMI_390]